MRDLFNIINPQEATILIAPSSYHQQLIERLTQEDKVIKNFQLLSPNSLLKKLLSENDIVFDDESNIVEKILINQDLINQDHIYKNNINYINELFKVKEEFFLSNLETPSDFEIPVKNNHLDLSSIKTTIQHIIVYTNQDIYPIHTQLLEHLQSIGVKVTFFDSKIKDSQYYSITHKNSVQMLDYIVYDIFNKGNFSNTLILCDDVTYQEYITSLFDQLRVPYHCNVTIKNPSTFKLIALFNIINNDYDFSDIETVRKLFVKNQILTSKDDDEEVDSLEKKLKLEQEILDIFTKIQGAPYHIYLQATYNILSRIQMFEMDQLNDLYKDLYLIDTTIDLSLLNQYLLNALVSLLNKTNEYTTDSVMIANSKFNAIPYEEVYVVDASLPDFKQKKVSYLLENKDRLEISPDLLNVQFYKKAFDDSKERLVSCGQNIYFSLPLINTDNKSKEMAYFVKTLHKKTLSHDFNHLFIQEPTTDASTLLAYTPLDSNKVLERINHTFSFSASALDTYGNCPYKYYINYLLKPRGIEEFGAKEVGSIYHAMLEFIISRHNEGKLDLRKAMQEKEVLDYLNDLINKDVETAKKYNTLFLNDQMLENLHRRMVKSLESTLDFIAWMLENTDYTFTGFETHSEYTNLPLSDGMSSHFKETKLKGIVDAILSYNNNQIVLDYKTNAKAFSETDFEAGIQNQLIVYLYMINRFSDKSSTGAFYKEISDNYHTVNNIFDKEQLLLKNYKENGLTGLYVNNYEDNYRFDHNLATGTESVFSDVKIKSNNKKLLDLETLEDKFSILENHINKLASALVTGEFKVYPYKEETCTYCDYKAICHFSKGMDVRKKLFDEEKAAAKEEADRLKALAKEEEKKRKEEEKAIAKAMKGEI